MDIENVPVKTQKEKPSVEVPNGKIAVEGRGLDRSELPVPSHVDVPNSRIPGRLIVYAVTAEDDLVALQPAMDTDYPDIEYWVGWFDPNENKLYKNEFVPE